MPSHDRRDPDHPLRRVKDYRSDGSRHRRWSGPERAFRLTYRRRPLTVIVSTIVAVLLPATLVVAGTRVDTGFAVPEAKRPMTAPLDWQWTDGGSDPKRVFYSSAYNGRSAALPKLSFRLTPGDNRLISLQFLQDGGWNDEWLTKADAKGNATMPIDPLCQDGSWCDGSYRYRVKIGDLLAHLDIAYWDR